MTLAPQASSAFLPRRRVPLPVALPRAGGNFTISPIMRDGRVVDFNVIQPDFAAKTLPPIRRAEIDAEREMRAGVGRRMDIELARQLAERRHAQRQRAEREGF